jgi:hypothetical protein
MKFAKIFLVVGTLTLFATFSGCGGGNNTNSAPDCPQSTSANNPVVSTASNVVPVTVSPGSYIAPGNQPMVSATICVPGTSTCQTINNLLLDTGSYGLRIFRSLITIALPQVTNPDLLHPSNILAECVGYLTGSQWGPLAVADVILGQGSGQKASSVNIQEVDASYPSGIPAGSDCASGADTDPAHAGYNGIIGVGLVANDCNVGCSDPTATYYFSCSGSSPCTIPSPGVAAAYQTTNPISKMPAGYNNGVSLTLPSVGACGNSGVSGYMTLGVGTAQSNNPAPAGVNIVPADSTFLTMLTTFQGVQNHDSFIDSGSNTYGIYPSGSVADDLTDCGGGAEGFFCPTDSPTYSATMQGIANGSVVTVPFEIVNSLSLVNSNNNAFSTIGSFGNSGEFDWGIDFFYGRTVYLVINNKTASGLGTGPLWAF